MNWVLAKSKITVLGVLVNKLLRVTLTALRPISTNDSFDCALILLNNLVCSKKRFFLTSLLFNKVSLIE